MYHLEPLGQLRGQFHGKYTAAALESIVDMIIRSALYCLTFRAESICTEAQFAIITATFALHLITL